MNKKEVVAAANAVAKNEVTITTEYVADGHRKLTKSYSGQKEMLADGWTQAEIDGLITAPRSAPDTAHPELWTPIPDDKYGNVVYPAGESWVMPKVDGYALCGTSLLTEAEKARRRAYEKAREKGEATTSARSSKSGSAKTMSVETAMLKILYERLKEIGDTVALDYCKKLMPKAKLPTAYKKLTGRDTVDDTVWTSYGLMYRGKDGEAEPGLTASELVEKLEQGWLPVLFHDKMEALIEECRKNGMMVTSNGAGYAFSMDDTVEKAADEATNE